MAIKMFKRPSADNGQLGRGFLVAWARHRESRRQHADQERGQLRNLIGLMPLGSRANLRLERNGNPVSASVDAGPARASAPQQYAGN